MKYPPEILMTMSDRELAALSRNAEARGADDQFAACQIELESRKSKKDR